MKFIKIFLIALSLLFVFTACKNIEDEKTTLEIQDNNRHYYPILMGQELQIRFVIKNTGEHPFILTDIISTCGCIMLDKSSIKTIPPDREGNLLLTYNSAKNIGYVQHFITLYGNFATLRKMEALFDVHVVPQSDYTRDYEEMFEKQKESKGFIEDLVDGNENNKGYYLDGDF